MPVSLPIGFNFRNSEAFITDTSPNVWMRGGGVFPYASSPGYGFVSDSAVATDNRNVSGGERLAGILYVLNNADPANAEFRVDIDPGSYTVRIAIGDYNDSQGPHEVNFYDGANTTPILTIATAATGAGQRWFDAGGTRRDGVSTWVDNNATASITLANSYLRVRFGEGDGSGSNYTTVSHLRIDAAAVPTAPTGPTTSSVTATGATASWTDASSDETSFDVQTAPAPYSSWTTASGSPTAANATSLALSGLTDGTSYKFRVRATNSNGSSAWVESGVFTTLSLTRLRPNADTTVGTATSTGANLFGVLDETVADDADYITIPGTLTSISVVQGHPSETNIKTWTPSPGGTFATSTLTMTSGEASAITDYAALYVKIVTSDTTVKMKFENSTDPANDNDHALVIRLRAA